MSGKQARFPLTDHQAVADTARRNPGTWLLANVYPGLESGRASARRVRVGGSPAYAPKGDFDAYAAKHDDGTAVWVRYVGTADDLEPMPDRIRVRVPDYGPGRGYEGVHIATVEISSRCQRCGGPRGPRRSHHFRKDDATHVCDRWENSCGHQDDYRRVRAEARSLRQRRKPAADTVAEIRGIEGGVFFKAVSLIAEAVQTKHALRARAAARLLDEHGEFSAAEVIRNYVQASVSGNNVTAKEAAYLLVQIDTAALKGCRWVDGRITYEATGRKAGTK
ncbi:hypothetical protein ACFYOF_20300 [Streptomyces sp. NPDC007148]|uniref:hypothetical protein n=1 Tax=Streptomyces sp. NPDC007148 TaxID=3364775 RepID=UPI0036AE3408